MLFLILFWLLQWLKTEALGSNPKIEATLDGRYAFKPPYKVRDRKGLLKLLRQTDLKGYGGILLEDIQESLPNHEKVLKVIVCFILSSGFRLIDCSCYDFIYSNLIKRSFTSPAQWIRKRFCFTTTRLH